MNKLKQVLHLLAGKSTKHVLPENTLSATELDSFQGGKPIEAILDTAYWWIEEPATPAFGSVINQAQQHL